jgi:hypothetical protein
VSSGHFLQALADNMSPLWLHVVAIASVPANWSRRGWGSSVHRRNKYGRQVDGSHADVLSNPGTAWVASGIDFLESNALTCLT